jgi:hypothetical protein
MNFVQMIVASCKQKNNQKIRKKSDTFLVVTNLELRALNSLNLSYNNLYATYPFTFVSIEFEFKKF